jgi:hypothetical protein
MPDTTKPFILEMDASKWAIGATLLQKQDDRQIHPCGYLSHALTQTERNWQIYDRELFNWQCADLIEIFINIAKLEWNEPLCPGTSIKQFGLDLLRCILAADVERLYDAAIDDVRANQYGVIPKNENPMDLICMKYTHPLTMIAPDRSHTIELINNVQDKMNDLTYYINKLSNLTKTIQ